MGCSCDIFRALTGYQAARCVHTETLQRQRDYFMSLPIPEEGTVIPLGSSTELKVRSLGRRMNERLGRVL